MKSRLKTASRLLTHWGLGVMLGAWASTESIKTTLAIGAIMFSIGQMGVSLLTEKKHASSQTL